MMPPRAFVLLFTGLALLRAGHSPAIPSGVFATALSADARHPDAAPAARRESGQEKVPQTPLFRSESALVTVDVVVVDKQGEPVRDLEAGDFTITDPKSPQKIEILTESRSLIPAANHFEDTFKGYEVHLYQIR